VERIAEDTRFNATDAYYQLQNADAQVAIAQAAVEDFSQTLRDAQLLEQAGLGTRFDVLQAEVDLANANQELTRAIADQRTARRQLAQILSLGQQVELTAANPIEEAGVWSLSLEESIVKAYKNRAELEQFLVQREINEQDREIALSEIRPQVSLFANYNFSNNFNDTFESALGFRDGYAVGARMSWRFFDGGRAFAREDQENRDIDIDETNFANQRDQVRLEVETGYYQLIANKENIGTTEQAVITATESLRLARLRFQAGVGTQTDVINAQRSLTDARGNFLQAIIGYNQSLNQLQRAVSNLPNNHLFELR
jgi:outer membrane protein TolC